MILKLSEDGTEAVLSKALSLEAERYDVMGTLGIARCENRSSPRTDFCAHLILPSCVSQWEVDFRGSRDHTSGFSRQRNGSYKGLRLKASDDAGIWYIRWEEGHQPKTRGC